MSTHHKQGTFDLTGDAPLSLLDDPDIELGDLATIAHVERPQPDELETLYAELMAAPNIDQAETLYARLITYVDGPGGIVSEIRRARVLSMIQDDESDA